MKYFNPWVAVYLLAIVVANVTAVAFGPTWTIVNAFLLIGLDLVIRDHLHDRWRSSPGRILALIVAGGALSYVVNSATLRIAIASSVAFTVAMAVNAIVYHFWLDHPFLVRSNVSNVPAAVFDSLLFPTIAFGMFMPWIVAGHVAAKVLGGGVWSLIIDWYRRRGEREDALVGHEG